jgi:MoxR-like ATPase
MAAGPQRRATRQAHLNAHIVPVEQALIARVDHLLAEAARIEAGPGESPDALDASARRAELYRSMATEHAALAEELHWRG